MIESEVLEQKKLIRKFKSIFYAEYGVMLHVFIPPADKNEISLSTLEMVTLARLYKDLPDFKDIATLLNRTRVKDYLVYVHCFCYIAYTLGYSKSYISKYLNKVHATVINSVRRVQDGIDTDDFYITKVYSNIINELENYVGTIPENIKIKDNTEPVADSIWDQARRFIAIHN